MARTLSLLSRFVAVLTLTFAAAVHGSAFAQESNADTVKITVDTPTHGTSVANGSSLGIGGWAVDTVGLIPGAVATAPGIDQIEIYIDGPLNGGGTLLGSASYGGSRPDVGAALGSEAYANSGFDFTWTVDGIPPGTHTLYVYAHAVASGWWETVLTIDVQGEPTTASSATDRSTAGQFTHPAAGSTQNAYAAGSSMAGAYAAGGYPNAPYSSIGAVTQGQNIYNAGFPYSNAGDPYLGAYSVGASQSPYTSVNPYAYNAPYTTLPAQPATPGYVSPPSYGPPPNYSSLGSSGPLSSPSGLTVVGVSGSTALLTWSPVPGAVNYRVYQTIAFTASPVPSATSFVAATSAVVSGLSANIPYTFQVVAVDAMGQHSPPSPATMPVTSTGM